MAVSASKTILSANASSTTSGRLQAAFRDMSLAFSMRELWLFLGWRDVQKHYRRSVLGPLWLTLSMGVIVGGMGVLYSQIFQIDPEQYLPFLAVGFIVWGMIGGALNAACTVFSSASHAIRQIRLPLMVYIFQFTWSQFITFSHNFIIYFLVILYFGINPGIGAFMAIPGLLVLVINVVFAAMILGPLCARFRDMPMIVGSIVQVLFFLTPVIWNADQLPDRAFFVHFNPFYHFLEIVRAPLLGGSATWFNWGAVLGITLFMGVFATLFFARYRARIAYWA
ncbi:ABC transporter permease [Aureimonas fodinaquatilis]|uniref:ABC transporter permease n=1 Tax=Aureimonas fodinaquatilis TaxID=2565783 RepID=A0A5B0DZR7_9HYPH|nr:ABC transporter permease [Aureimonas fodinaquatilis]KAA0972043.1 ABC transporter permease [Aureimonas fodinaquatilis]